MPSHLSPVYRELLERLRPVYSQIFAGDRVGRKRGKGAGWKGGRDKGVKGVNIFHW